MKYKVNIQNLFNLYTAKIIISTINEICLNHKQFYEFALTPKGFDLKCASLKVASRTISMLIIQI